MIGINILFLLQPFAIDGNFVDEGKERPLRHIVDFPGGIVGDIIEHIFHYRLAMNGQALSCLPRSDASGRIEGPLTWAIEIDYSRKGAGWDTERGREFINWMNSCAKQRCSKQ